jgi:hypothetical protein
MRVIFLEALWIHLRLVDPKGATSLSQLGSTMRRRSGCNENEAKDAKPATRHAGLMGVQVVEDQVNLPRGVVGDHLVHELEKPSTPSPLVMPSSDLAGCDIERGKERRPPVALVALVKTSDGLPVWKPQPALSMLESLDLRFCRKDILTHAIGGVKNQSIPDDREGRQEEIAG